MTEYSSLGPGREFDLIRTAIERLPEHNALTVGPGDDAAVLPDGWVVSTDASVENIHFRRAWLSPVEIGARAVIVALSDLAAMASVPVATLVSLVLPSSDYADVAPDILKGAAQASQDYGAALAGGDTTRSDSSLVIGVTVVGRTNHPVLRSGAKPGDEVWVTGELGGAAAAVVAWNSNATPDPAARNAFARPGARVREALWLSERVKLHALIDLSDGLASDAAHVAAASGVSLLLETGALPVHPSAQAQTDAIRLAAAGGDDYELCLVAPAGAVGNVKREFEQQFQLRLTQIGSVEPGAGVIWLDDVGRPLDERLKGFDHFDRPR